MKRAKAPTTERKRLDVIECPSSVESTRLGTDAWTGAVRYAGVGERPRPSIGDRVQTLSDFCQFPGGWRHVSPGHWVAP